MKSTHVIGPKGPVPCKDLGGNGVFRVTRIGDDGLPTVTHGPTGFRVITCSSVKEAKQAAKHFHLHAGAAGKGLALGAIIMDAAVMMRIKHAYDAWQEIKLQGFHRIVEAIAEEAIPETDDPILKSALAGMARDDGTGICLECGADRQGVEPDAEGYVCEICGAHAVMGAEQIVIMRGN